MKLDVNALRYLSREEFRTLQAVEVGQRNHDVVPTPLIDSIAGLKHGGTVRCLKGLLRQKLVHHEGARVEGYRLTTLGYDYLALKALVERGAVAAVGRQVGVGKESDVFEVLNAEGEVLALKLHRLGRASFRAVKQKRDYLRHRTSFSWLYLSRLAALKEFAFMEALGRAGFPVPTALEHNRHAVLMSLIPAVPLVQLRELAHPGRVYEQIMGLATDLASRGLVHCDFNEFNLLVDDEEQVTLIDFPQMVSTAHPNAADLFQRDVDCISRFFAKKLGYLPQHDREASVPVPCFEDIVACADPGAALDVQLSASGFKPQHAAALERWAAAANSTGCSVEGTSSDDATSEEAIDDSSRAQAESCWHREGLHAGDSIRGWDLHDEQVDGQAQGGCHAKQLTATSSPGSACT